MYRGLGCTFAGLLLLAGCATAPARVAAPAPALPSEPALQFPAESNAVKFLDDFLPEFVSLAGAELQRTPENTVEVVCTFTNLSDLPVSLQARTQYFDRDKRRLDGPGPWEAVELAPRASQRYTARAAPTGLDCYYVEVMLL